MTVETLEKVIETTEQHSVEGLEITAEVSDYLIEYVGTLEYTRPVAFSVSFNLNEIAEQDKKSVRKALISSAVYTDDEGGPVNGFLAQNAKFKKLINLILADFAEISDILQVAR